MKPWLLVLLATVCSACGNVDPDPPPPPPGEPCEAGSTGEFTLGVIVYDDPRWFRAFDENCRTIELQTGLQGGWHTEPALQAPRSAANADLGGRILWSVADEQGNVVADAEFELFRSFWQTLKGGDAYWGDFVIFDRDPTALVGSKLTIECQLDFDPESRLEDLTLSTTVTLVDEDPNTEFR